ncbi:MAG: amine oxidase [Bacteroidetes bacterium]|nr:MAG: amine oxidase [Bacteroidota bacterium]TAG89876.1 MAG: amine oxidase [Bacteroidota bacterium]
MSQKFDTIIIGTGLGALSTACLLAKQGQKNLILEQNYLAGGCTSSYWRKGFVFESGATTLVGLEKNMPLGYVLNEIGITINARKLETPMKIHLKNGEILTRHQNLEEWILEAERVFGKKNQREFWNFCYRVSCFVWQTSLKQRFFPPKKINDFLQCVKNATFSQFNYAIYAFYSTEWLLKKYDLLENELFVAFVNEQLIITAQNYLKEVNILFGATALCYTNFPNYYVDGGLINVINPMLNYLEKNNTEIHLREEVKTIVYQKEKKLYQIITNKNEYESKSIVSGIPLNNTLKIYANTSKKLQKKILNSTQLSSAFQMGIGFECLDKQKFSCIHYQIHLENPLPFLNTKSIFISLSHADDDTRTDQKNQMVASISTHWHNPEKILVEDKSILEKFVLDILIKKGFFEEKDIIYYHSSGQKSWEKWTGRMYGFVGGYPQYKNIKPWQMVESRLDNHKAYICGDTTYPGQGIPGTVLSGIIAFEKMRADGSI